MMMDQAFQKRGEPASAGRGRLRLALCSLVCLLVLAAFLVCAAPARAAETGEGTASAAHASQCKGLKPFNNIDELLYQFYINLDSDCLFKMPVEELEKVWGIKILDEERFKPKNYYPFSETAFYFKPYKSEKDAFYVERIRVKFDDSDRRKLKPFNKFMLKPTKEYSEKHSAFFSDGKLPNLLPATIESGEEKKIFYQTTDHTGSVRITPNGEVEIARYSAKPIMARIVKKQDPPQNEEQVAGARNTGNTPCRGLKPFNNIEELLYQFYINLDSDCLFKMPVAELEKAWGTKILSDERRGPDGRYDPSDFDFKPYESERDAFYVQIPPSMNPDRRIFQIVITQKYHEKHATLFPDGDYPKPLPPPKTIPSNWIIEGPSVGTPPPLQPKDPGRYMMRFRHYYWLNSDKTRIIELTGFYGVGGVDITEYVLPAYKQ